MGLGEVWEVVTRLEILKGVHLITKFILNEYDFDVTSLNAIGLCNFIKMRMIFNYSKSSN